eukprot:jgi/Botrbrau1/20525/Bobra.145_2s0077.1
METNILPAVLPFSECLLEEDFRRSFHNRRALLDIATAAFVTYHVSKSLLSGETEGMDPTLIQLWIAMSIAEFMVVCGTFHPGKPPLITVPSHPGYISWRLYIMMGLRAVSCILLFWSTREALTTLNAPTFSKAAFYVLLHYSRFRFPLYMALLFQIPLKQGQIIFQTVLVSFLLTHSSGECRADGRNQPRLTGFCEASGGQLCALEAGGQRGGMPAPVRRPAGVLWRYMHAGLPASTAYRLADVRSPLDDRLRPPPLPGPDLAGLRPANGGAVRGGGDGTPRICQVPGPARAGPLLSAAHRSPCRPAGSLPQPHGLAVLLRMYLTRAVT